jgi:DNA polymerase
MTRPLLPLDFETYYENQGYTLKKLTYIEYVTHELFKIHGVGFIWNGQRYWMTDMDEFAAFLDDIGEDVELLCHNTMFDGYILHHCFNWHPKVYRDTQGMSRGMFVGQSASLDALTKRLFPNDPTKRKGKELMTFAGLRDLSPEQEKVLGGYCLNDVDIMLADYEVMLPHYPDREMELIDLTLQMYCDPIFEIDEALVEQTHKEKSEERQRLIKESGIAESTLSSNTKFKEWIEKQGIEPPTKVSLTTGEETFAGGKNDLAFQLMRRQHPKLNHVWAGRIAAKSTGEISRAERFLQVARDTGGLLPVPLNYYSAHTGRYGGCLTADTEVMVLSEYSQCGYEMKPITQVTIDDLIWDGTAFVAHEGVVFSGMREVITYDDVTGTPDHIVFTRDGQEKSLAQAREDGDRLTVPDSPDHDQVALGRAFGRDHHQIHGDTDMPELWHRKTG